jgi:GntR family transcriptional regulator
MIIDIDPTNGLPIFLQIIEQVKYKIAAGALQEGDQLPSVRQLATHLRINPNTVSKAYNELERNGLIQTRRGMGCFVTDKGLHMSKEERLNIIARHLDRALIEAHHLQIDFPEVQTLLQQRYEKLSERRPS